ncbi:MAG TPA: hypothetical protein VH062_07520 [Polyangiaceae bacterium]|jgi:hypothetical protein|nr:hypothetical protein [Polyangiaceae bacterium]
MRGLLAFGSAALLVAGCSVYDSSLKQRPAVGAGGASTGGAAGGGGGGTSGGGMTAAGGVDSGVCTLKTYPPKPTGTNLGGDREIIAVQSDIDLGDVDTTTTNPSPMNYLAIGYDLDKLCDRTATTALTMPGCTLPKGSLGIIDGPNGQDNSMGALIQLVHERIPNFSSVVYSQQLQNGAANAVLHVTGYNGTPDDDQVRLEALVSARFDALQPGATPKWDGTDVWPIASDSVSNNNLKQPKNVDNNAYISGGKLVGTLGDSGFRLLIGLTAAFKVNLSLQLHAAFLVCDVKALDAASTNFTLKNCTLAGRWTTDQLLKQVWHFPDPLDLTNPKPLCTNSTSYSIFKTAICQSADITSSGTAGPTDPCDAISFGVNFNTEPALLGDVFAVDLTAPACDPDVDPTNDSCESNDAGLPPGTGGGGGAGGAGGATSSGGSSSGGRDAGIRDAGADG